MKSDSRGQKRKGEEPMAMISKRRCSKGTENMGIVIQVEAKESIPESEGTGKSEEMKE